MSVWAFTEYHHHHLNRRFSHPNLIKTFGVGLYPEFHMVLELISGGDLQEHFDRIVCSEHFFHTTCEGASERERERERNAWC
jgi:serine/threonine protein kinase